MKKHIEWKYIANSIAFTDWGTNSDCASADDFIKNTSLDQKDVLVIALLADIAKSLRALRCVNFTGIPNVLRDIRRNTTKPKKRKAKKK